MEHDDEIEKISKELEDILQMTSGEKENTTGEKDLKEGNEEERVAFDPQGERAEQEFDLASAPGIHLDIPVDGLEELFDGDMDYGEDLEQEKETVPDQNFLDISEEPEDDEDEEELEIGQLESFKERASGKKEGKAVSLVRPSDGLLAAFFVPMVIMIIIFAQRGIFPFGEESFLRTDMYHQYAPFFSEFRYKLTHGGSLLYSWDIGMGVNFAALYAYYLASPLNWLLVLCPKNYVIEFMTYMIVFKIGLSGLSFSWYLRRHNRTMDFGVAFFGIFYALSGYMAAYSWNIMWLDCILLFPLIMLGLERLVKEKKCFFILFNTGIVDFI
uniref:YfhO family protein n=1 Tax=Clostridium sp. NkU-1 TaxID=1095009 RepID=UPI000AD61C4B